MRKGNRKLFGIAPGSTGLLEASANKNSLSDAVSAIKASIDKPGFMNG